MPITHGLILHKRRTREHPAFPSFLFLNSSLIDCGGRSGSVPLALAMSSVKINQIDGVNAAGGLGYSSGLRKQDFRKKMRRWCGLMDEL